MEDESMAAPAAKRVCRYEVVESAPASCTSARLDSLDRYSLYHLLTFLDARTAVLLIWIGNLVLGASVKSQLSFFRFQEVYIRDYHRKKNPVLRWPALLAPELGLALGTGLLHLPLLHTLLISTRNVDLWRVNFTALPKSLTRLSLKHTTFRGEFDEEGGTMDLNLPNLTRLSVCMVAIVCRPSYEPTSTAAWLTTMLPKLPRLLRLSYFPCEQKLIREDYSKLAHVLPPTLESLYAPPNLITCVGSWPLNLHTLRWSRHNPGSEAVKVIKHNLSLPQSITAFRVDMLENSWMLYLVLDALPAHLLHLTIMDYEMPFSDEFIGKVARFSQLQSLLTSTPHWQNSNRPLTTTVDLSRLPRTITRLADSYGWYWNQWKNLPPRARLVEVDRDGEYYFNLSEYRSQFQPQCPSTSAESEHFPTSLERVRLTDEPPARPFIGLQRALVVVRADILVSSQCQRLLDAAACDTLTHLRIEILMAKSLCSLGNNTSRRFPSLVNLSIRSEHAPSCNQSVRDWISNAPRNVRYLALELLHLNKTPLDECDPLFFDPGMLPPNLEEFWFISVSYVFSPVFGNVPATLSLLNVRCRAFRPHLKDEQLAALSKSIRTLHLCTSDHTSVNLSKEAVAEFENVATTTRPVALARDKRILRIVNLK